ncbi:glycosyltransferase [Bacillus mycoides]|uniref:glycosyltransferase family 4 protein n=1 Tax=Bacillus mycoides TaxID=1405 RepID=UPI001C015D61|nr:glycosyltransferase family 4 protein [Bacillus mycoides]QWH20204.1 glycosyltransferase [Bacillus mycoides]
MKKILFITNRLPFPKVDGRKNILMQYIENIKHNYPDSKLVNASFVDEKGYLKNTPGEIDRLIELEKPGFLSKLYNVVLYSVILRKWPLQVSLYYSKKNHEYIKKVVEEEAPDTIIYDMVRTAEYVVSGKDTQLIMNYDDMLSLRYKRQLDHLKYSPSILGAMSKKVPRVMRRLIEWTVLKKFILNFESNLLFKYETGIAARYDGIVFTSPKEAENFASLTNHPNCIGIPMHFELEEGDKIKQLSTSNRLVFVGKMDIPHNISAVLFFCESIWPEIKKKYSDMEFHIIGKNPTREVQALQDQHLGVKVVGEVEDMKKELADAAIFVAPLIFGTGIKTKIIEALSMEIPVVTTSIGAEGIEYRNEYHMFVADDHELQVKYISRLLDNHKLRKEIGSQGKKMVSEGYSKDMMSQKWKIIIN